ncbi:MAG: copper amine oxidase N-terminal domain-containing protein [Armatimonadetes bacterium]|nr:copper amine oxidase N-terminal domain-containing protein [Armatimonadota bacterium]
MRRAHLRIAIILSLLVFPSAVWCQDIQVVLNGEALSFDQPPAMIGGRLMVPLRGIFEALSADVLYDAATRTIKATKGSTVVELTLGSREARINGRPEYLDVPAGTLGGRTMVPLRFVSESLGADVKWQGATRTVMISDQTGDGTEPPPPPPQGGRPQIDQVIHNATGPLKPGDSIEVIMTGDPDGEASFEIVGVTDTLPMRHAGRGRYEGRYVIPQGLDVAHGIVVGHLVRNGLETIKEASRPLTIEPQAAVSVELSPAAGEVVTVVRPQIQVRFTTGLQPSTARFFLDGRDFTQQVQWTQNGLSFTPVFDLSAGKHSARVVGRDLRGAAIDRRWDFTIDQAAAAGPVQQFYPQNSSTVSTARPAIGVRLDPGYRVAQARLLVDGQDYSQAARLAGSDLIWNPTFDLAPGAHNVRLEMNDVFGQPDQVEWSFVIAAQAIQSIQIEPTTVQPAQALRVTAIGQPGGRAWMTLGSRSPVQMSEVSPGTYVGTYVAGSADQGQHPVEVTLQIGTQRYKRFADAQVSFSAPAQEAITSFAVSPTGSLSRGQTVTFTVAATSAREVRLNAFGSDNIRMQETSTGVYTVTLAVPTNIAGGSATVSARMRRQDGAWISRSLTLQVASGQTPSGAGLAIHNISEGMALPPVFNVQGTSTPGTAVSVRVDYQKPALGGIFMENRSFEANGMANANGHFDIQVDASRVAAGQQMQMTVTAGGEQRTFRLSRR